MSRSSGGSLTGAAGGHGDDRSVTRRKAEARVGYDYVHSAVDDHTRLAYSEIHRDEKGDTAAGFMARAAEFFAVGNRHGSKR